MRRNRREKGGCARMDSLYNSDEFRMYCFKVLSCSRHYCHDWTECPFAHPGEKARRRDPRVFRYVGIECPQVKEGGKCPRGDLCPFVHNVFECWLHPTRYRTQLCNEPASCKRKVCFFAHTVEELREPTTSLEHLMDPSLTPTTGTTEGHAAAEGRASLELGSPQNGNTISNPAWSGADVPRIPSQSMPLEAQLAALQLQSQRGHNPNISPADLSAVMEQLSLLKSQSASQSIANNDRVVQLLVLLLKEVATARQNSPQPQGRQSLDGRPVMPYSHRASLDATYFRDPAQPQTTQRLSMDAARLNYNMMNNLGKTQRIHEDVPADSTGIYRAPVSIGRISIDGSSIPDFVLHDTRSRATSLDSNVSETFGMAHPGRMSIDSASSFISGDRRISIDNPPDAFRISGVAGEHLSAGFVRSRYEPRASLDSGVSESIICPTGIAHISASNFSVGK